MVELSQHIIMNRIEQNILYSQIANLGGHLSYLAHWVLVTRSYLLHTSRISKICSSQQHDIPSSYLGSWNLSQKHKKTARYEGNMRWICKLRKGCEYGQRLPYARSPVATFSACECRKLPEGLWKMDTSSLEEVWCFCIHLYFWPQKGLLWSSTLSYL